jgi:hypothetical protein
MADFTYQSDRSSDTVQTSESGDGLLVTFIVDDLITTLSFSNRTVSCGGTRRWSLSSTIDTGGLDWRVCGYLMKVVHGGLVEISNYTTFD